MLRWPTRRAGLSRREALAVLYAGGAPEAIYGLMQINFQLPETFPPPYYVAYRFALQVGGATGGSASVAIGR